MKTNVSLLLAVFMIISLTHAGTITVGPDSEDYATISDALQAATSGDQVIVFPGTYAGPITLAADVHLVSSGCDHELYNSWYTASLDTVIDGEGAAPVVRLAEGSTIEGFTITDAGGGFAVYGLYVTADVIGNRITGNAGGGLYLLGGGKIHKNLVADNDGIGIELAYSNAAVHLNTIADNDGSGIKTTESTADIMNNIISVNGTTGTGSSGIQAVGTTVPTISYNDVLDNLDTDYLGCTAGAQDISSNPVFYDDYCIGSTSPCADAGFDCGDGYLFWNDIPDLGWFEFSVHELPVMNIMGMAILLGLLGFLLRRKGVLLTLLICIAVLPNATLAETMFGLYSGDEQIGVPTMQLDEPLVVKLGNLEELLATDDTYVQHNLGDTVLNTTRLIFGRNTTVNPDLFYYTYLKFDYPGYEHEALRTFLRIYPYYAETQYGAHPITLNHVYRMVIPFDWSETTATWNNTDPSNTLWPTDRVQFSLTEWQTCYHELELNTSQSWFTPSPENHGVALYVWGTTNLTFAEAYSKEAAVDTSMKPTLLVLSDNPTTGVSGQIVSFHWRASGTTTWLPLLSTTTDSDGLAEWHDDCPDYEGEIEVRAYCAFADFGNEVLFNINLVKPVIMGDVNLMSYPGSTPTGAGENVVVINPVEGIEINVTTDVDGHYTTTDDPTVLPTGEYYVTAEVDNCLSDLIAVTVDPPDTYEQDIQVLCGMVYGRVNSPTGPKSGAVVTLQEEGTTQVTTSEGDFLFLVSPATLPATYTLSAVCPGGDALPAPAIVVLTAEQPVAEANFCWMPTDGSEFPGDAYTYYPSHFSSPAFDPAHVNLGGMPDESIDALTGQVHLRYTDLSLPGKGGLDLNLIRTYGSTIRERAPWVDDTQFRTRFVGESCLGLGWDLHLGKIADPNSETPVMMLPDGSRQPFYTVPSSAPGGFPKYSTDRWRLDDLGANDLLVTSPDGLHYYFDDADRYTVMNVLECWQREYASVTEIRSADADAVSGNRISVTYSYVGGRHVIAQVVDTYGRVIGFTHDPSTGYLTAITGPNGSLHLKYEVTAISTYHSALTEFTAYAAGTGGSPGDLQTTYGYGSAIADADYCRL
ncbi:DNRLRE domain-containing protein, partial [bacterium]|nr:DNRLRE domain-containing protein [candidate division CSSED10-310 bacterium]